jgi:shikimate dehydrogenase
VAAVIGDPVRQSLSPILHNAAFRELGLDWVYVALPVAAGRGAQAVEAARVLGISGLSVTMPHKAAVAGAVDRLSPTAARLGAVNTVTALSGEMVGDNTDGPGFVDALRRDDGWDPAGRDCLVLGTGGAARAVCLALAEARAATVTVIGRRAEAAAETVSLAGPAGRVGQPGDVAGAALVVNATPVGMHTPGGGGGQLPFGIDPAMFGPGQLVVDLVYSPPRTALLDAARRRGALTANGLGMLIHQAARQLAIWTGMSAPLEAMSAAAVAELGRRSG